MKCEESGRRENVFCSCSVCWAEAVHPLVAVRCNCRDLGHIKCLALNPQSDSSHRVVRISEHMLSDCFLLCCTIRCKLCGGEAGLQCGGKCDLPGVCSSLAAGRAEVDGAAHGEPAADWRSGRGRQRAGELQKYCLFNHQQRPAVSHDAPPPCLSSPK